MARIVGVDLPRDKRVEIGLTYIFGVGRSRADQALAATGVDPNTRVRDLSEADVIALRDYIEANAHRNDRLVAVPDRFPFLDRASLVFVERFPGRQAREIGGWLRHNSIAPAGCPRSLAARAR